MKPLVFVLLILVAPLASAATLSVTYSLEAGETRVDYFFSDVTQPISVPLPSDVREVLLNQEPQLATSSIVLEQDTNLSFTTQALSRQTGYFVADLGRINADIDVVEVRLPPGAQLEQALTSNDPSIRPAPTSATTDGQRLIFVYQGASLEPARAIIVDYEVPTNNQAPVIILSALLVLLLTVWYVRRRQRTTNTQTGITRNLYRDEKLLVELLLEAPEQELWQNELTRKSDLSKVKVSRRIRSLEAKGVIEKIPHGNTNRIRIKKQS